MGQLAREAASVAESLGVRLPFNGAAVSVQSNGPESAAEEVARQTAGNVSSMLQDVLRRAPTEVDAINGAVVVFGEKRHVPTPVNRVIWSLVKAIPVSGKI